MKKIVAINYFEQRVDLEGLEAYKENFTATVPVAESTDDGVAYDYYRVTDYSLTLYVRDINGNNAPFIRFKFDNAELDPKVDRELTGDEIELANCIIEAEHLDIEVAA